MTENFISNLPPQFARNVLEVCGETGERWTNDLPQIIAELSKIWSLAVEKPFPNLSYNFVAPCVYKDNGAVLKIALPLKNPEIYDEARFLKLMNGKGAVRLLEINETYRAILLERLTPGKHLKEVCRKDDEKAVEITIRVMRQLLKKPPKNSAFRRLDEWFGNFFVRSQSTNFPLEFQNKTREIYKEVSSASKHKFLIHGDLHHENILSAGRGDFTAIDPKAIVGDIGYEISVFLNNHLWWLAADPNLREKLNAAVKSFSKAFEIEPQALKKWAFAQMILSVWWTFEENGGENWEKNLELAKIWEE